MPDKDFTDNLREAVARLIRAGVDDQQIAAQCSMLGSSLTMELGICPIREEDLIGVIRGLLAQNASPVQTGVAEIDRLGEAESKRILAEIFRFMYQREDGAWDRDKEIRGTEMVDLLCSEMPEMSRHEEKPGAVSELVSRRGNAGVPDSTMRRRKGKP
jgi:hypothetical protein